MSLLYRTLLVILNSHICFRRPQIEIKLFLLDFFISLIKLVVCLIVNRDEFISLEGDGVVSSGLVLRSLTELLVDDSELRRIDLPPLDVCIV